MNNTYNEYVEKYAVVKDIVKEMVDHQPGSFKYPILRALQNM